AGHRGIEGIDQELARPQSARDRVVLMLVKAVLRNYEGEPALAADVLADLRAVIEDDEALAEEWLYTVIFYQGVTGLRRGETDNCVLCEREGGCILPLMPSAAHADQTGSRQAVLHFGEYLRQFPDDLEVRWLLDLAHATLGEPPDESDGHSL